MQWSEKVFMCECVEIRLIATDDIMYKKRGKEKEKR